MMGDLDGARSGAKGDIASLIPLLLAHHEQSETAPTESGWVNIYGRATPQAGEPLPKRHDFEQPSYPTMEDAVMTAVVRSMMEGLRSQFLGGNLPGRR